MLLEECKCVAKRKMTKYITDDISICSDYFDRGNSDYSDEERSNEGSDFE